MKAKKIPLRKCVACQQMFPKKELLRIVRTPAGEVELDSTGKKSGRGAYVCAKSECFDMAQKRKSLERALDVKLSGDVYLKLAQQLDQSVRGRV